jgi:hypothetical protein
MWSYQRGEYFLQLWDYCRAYDEMRAFMTVHYSANALLSKRVEQLPVIKYSDYSGDNIGWATLAKSILSYLLLPLAYFWLYKSVRYVNSTRSKIQHASSLYSSVAFLIKAELQ